MKRLQLFSYVLFASIALHGAEQKQIEPWKDINYAEVKQILKQDYESYLKNRLEEYKKTDFTPADMNHMLLMSTIFTGQMTTANGVHLHYLLDNQQNTFTHIAIRKADLAILRWMDCLKEGRYLTYGITTDDAKTPIDLCIDQLWPNVIQQKNTEVTHEMLDVLTAAYDTYGFNLDYRKNFLRKMIALQLEHKKCNTGFQLKEVLFTRFLVQDNKNTQKPIVLSDIYQEVMNQDKNTFTHVIVQQNLPEELYNLIKKEYVSFTKNAEEKTPVDLALETFRKFTQNHSLMESDKDTFNKHRCCLFMLLNYAQTKQNKDNKNVVICCDKHLL